jgi:precorrin-6Y C5,15-methyltransferase (decarboxylating)
VANAVERWGALPGDRTTAGEAEATVGEAGATPVGHVGLVGLVGGRCFGAPAEEALAAADVIFGAARHLAELDPGLPARRIPFGPSGSSLTDVVAQAGDLADDGHAVVIVASGDPGFFGLVRLAASRLGPGRLVVHPAPSSVSLAFARLGDSWDDARVVSAHGRELDAAADAVAAAGPGAHKVAVLVSPDAPPEALAHALIERGVGLRRVAVCAQLGTDGETITESDLAQVAAGSWDPMSVVIIRTPLPTVGRSTPDLEDTTSADLAAGAEAPLATVGRPTLVWGAPVSSFVHRDGMITKAEVRAVALGKLTIPASGVMWDLGAGSGSVAAEVAALSPGLAVYAVERNVEDVERIRANVAGLGVTVINGAAPEALAGLPDPDRVFVGGGGLEVLDAALDRLRPGGTIVATYATLDRAAAAGRRLGQLIQLSVSRGKEIGADGGLRLQGENPVFICWGPPAPTASPGDPADEIVGAHV